MAKEYRADMATVDHIVPLSKGGLHVEDNVQLACMACNASKSDTLTAERQLLLW
jgi:5-methylcytosine-specific restriction endonuclease McrA